MEYQQQCSQSLEERNIGKKEKMFPCVGFMHSKAIELNQHPLTMQRNGELLKLSNPNPWLLESLLQLIKQLPLLLLSYK